MLKIGSCPVGRGTGRNHVVAVCGLSVNRAKAMEGEGCEGLKITLCGRVDSGFLPQGVRGLVQALPLSGGRVFFVQQVEGGHGGEYVQFVVGEGGGGGSGRPAVGQFVFPMGVCFGIGRGFTVVLGIDGEHGEPTIVQHLLE